MVQFCFSILLFELLKPEDVYIEEEGCDALGKLSSIISSRCLDMKGADDATLATSCFCGALLRTASFSLYVRNIKVGLRHGSTCLVKLFA